MRAPGESGIVLFTAWMIGIIQCGALLLASVWIATRAPVFDCYYASLVHSPGPADAHQIAAWLSSSNSKQYLESKITQGHLTERELNHYADVRSWLRKVPAAFLVCASVCIALYLAGRRPNFLPLIEARALVFVLALLCGCVSLASWDWRIFFTWVHYPLFGATSWRFPRGSYSLQLFPVGFWRAAGIFVIAPALLTPILILLMGAAGQRKNRTLAGSLTI